MMIRTLLPESRQRAVALLALLSLSLLVFPSSARAYTREEVVKRDRVRCGVATGVVGFAAVDAQGHWSGLDVDICRAVAAAVLGSGDKVEFLPLAGNESFTALMAGEVDLLSRHSGWTMARDGSMPVNFAGVSYYDGQGLMVAASLDAKKAADLKKVRVCNPVESRYQRTLVDFFDENKIEYKMVPYADNDLAVRGFSGGDCDVLTMPRALLYGVQNGLATPESGVVLPDSIAKEPMGPVVRHGDDTWFDIVKWTLFALLDGEELGIRSSNIEEMRISNRLAVKQFFGLEENYGRGLGLPADWAVQVIREVGNYGEVFARNFGEAGRIHLERGLNRLWNDGGLQYAPPIR